MIDHLKSLTNEFIDSFDLSHLEKLGFRMQNNLLYPPGNSPFKLYAYLSTLFNNKIILDIGTEYGNSALAFSYNENNKIISYNILEQGASNISKENIIWKVMDFRNDDTIDYDNVEIICIDVDPHDGKQEVEMIQFLKDRKWSGILLLDDIHKDQQMDDFWSSLDFSDDVKYDISSIGHSSGTGVILF